jgi:hypothetical protein
MLPTIGSIEFERITEKDVLNIKDNCISLVGLPEIADMFDISYNRNYVDLKIGDIVFIINKIGNRPAEHETGLNGRDVEFIRATITE